jgi:Tol biopolymer transport system component
VARSLTRAGAPLAAMASAVAPHQPRTRGWAAGLIFLWSALLAGLALATPARAAFPGRNGAIAYQSYDSHFESSAVKTVRPDGTRHRWFFDPEDRKECPKEGGTGFRTCVFAPGAYSPGGGRLLVAAYEGRAIGFFVVPANNPRQARLLRKGRRRVFGNDPSWSPDGHAVIYTDADRAGTIRRLRANRTKRLGRGYDAQWSRRGRIAFVRRDGSFESLSVYTMTPRGRGVRRIGSGSSPDWSPHGRWLAFTTPDGRLVMANRGETRTLPVPSNLSGCEAAFSPDGRQIVFRGADRPAPPPSSDACATSRGSLYAMRLDGSGLRRITPLEDDFSDTSVGSPTWQPLRRKR